jgi:superfamily I DNA/RNA helicase
MNWSTYQQALFAATEQHVVVEAVAGSGKTTTIVQMAKQRSGSLFLAFNKSIATELASRGVNASTMHALGLDMCRSEYGKVKVEPGKKFEIFEDMGINEHPMRFRIANLVSLARCWCIGPDTKRLQDLADAYDIELPDKVWDLGLVETFHRMATKVRRTPKGAVMVDFDDMVSLPVEQKFKGVATVKSLFVDEAQDLNKQRLELVDMLIGPDTKTVFVGDPHQAIYGFCGALSDSMTQVTMKYNAATYPLSVSYRCARSVIEVAQRDCPSILPSETAPEGIVTRVEDRDCKPAVGDVVLSRVTAPLVKLCYQLVKKGIRAAVKGKEIGEDIVRLIDDLSKKDGGLNIEDFLVRLNQHVVDTSLVPKVSPTKLAALEDKAEALNALAEGCGTVGGLKSVVQSLFNDDARPEDVVTLSTIHKAKGLEWHKVWLLMYKLPHPKASSVEARKQESNLRYVGVTRAKYELVLVGQDSEGDSDDDC